MTPRATRDPRARDSTRRRHRAARVAARALSRARLDDDDGRARAAIPRAVQRRAGVRVVDGAREGVPGVVGRRHGGVRRVPIDADGVSTRLVRGNRARGRGIDADARGGGARAVERTHALPEVRAGRGEDVTRERRGDGAGVRVGADGSGAISVLRRRFDRTFAQVVDVVAVHGVRAAVPARSGGGDETHVRRASARAED